MFSRTQKYIFASVIALPLLAGCSEDEPFLNGGGAGNNSGVISQDNFTLLFSDVAPQFFNPDTNTYSTVEIEASVFIGDRNNQTLTDAHTIFFETEWGLIDPSCRTSNGTCSVTWRSTSPDTAPLDFRNRIVAYAKGEESFVDINNNGIFDDGDLFTAAMDITEPFIDANSDGIYNSSTELIIDTNRDGVHNLSDGFYNGSSCTHSSLCSTTQRSVTVWEGGDLILTGTATFPPATFTIGGSVSGLAGTGLTLRNNGADDLSVTANGTYTFATAINDGTSYVVTVFAQPTSPIQTCTVANAMGNATANVTDVNVTCATATFTIGGTVNGITSGGLVLQNNGGDDLTIMADGAFTFSTAIADGAMYTVTIPTNTTGLACTFTPGTDTGTVASANVTNVTIGCL